MAPTIDHDAHSEPDDYRGDLYRPDVDTSDIDEKKLMRRVDWHVIPWLALLYLLNFMDRGSIGNAKVRRLCSFQYHRQTYDILKVIPYGERLGNR